LLIFDSNRMKAGSTSQEKFSPHIALFVVQVMFGSAAVLGKAALQFFSSYAIVGFRVGGAALTFYLLQRISGGLRLQKKIHYLYFGLFSCFGVIFNQLLFFKGLSLTTATNTSLLAVTMPIFTILVSALIGNDKLSWRKGFGVALAAAGVIYLINPAQAGFSSQTTQGDILIIFNCLSYSIYVAISKRLFSFYGALKSIAWLFIFGSIINVPVGLYFLKSVEFGEVTFSAWCALAAIVIFPTILAYYLNAWALTRVEPSLVAIYIYLQPLIGFMMAVLFLGETWNYRAVLAMFLIFIGVFLVTFDRSIKDERALHLT
jgi:drug/metabolite transporter (DMT)-like permease